MKWMEADVLSVGSRVVCTNDRIAGANTCYRTQTLPKAGRIYTVRAIVPCIARGYDEDGLHLVEIVNRPRLWRSPTGRRTAELAFRVSRFRPVRSTDISVFLQMLEPTRVLEVAIDRSAPFPGIPDADIGNQQGTDGFGGGASGANLVHELLSRVGVASPNPSMKEIIKGPQ